MQIKFKVLLALLLARFQPPFKVKKRRMTLPASYQEFGLGVVALTCNPSTQEEEDEAGWSRVPDQPELYSEF